MHIIVCTGSGSENTFPLVGERRLTHPDSVIGEVDRGISSGSNVQLLDTITTMNGLVSVIIGRL